MSKETYSVKCKNCNSEFTYNSDDIKNNKVVCLICGKGVNIYA